MDIFIDPIFAKYYEASPLVLIDAGARGGLQKNWRRAKKHLKVIGFEPDPKECRKLAGAAEGGPVKYINSALYSKEGPLRIFLTKNRGVSSVYRPDAEFLGKFPEKDRYQISESLEIQADTLDGVLRSGGVTDADFIKLDTQGSELDILRGASKTVDDRIFGLEIEAETVPIYESQPLFSDIDNFLRERGFFLFDIRPFYWKREKGKDYGYAKGQMIFADTLYLRRPESFASLIAKIEDGAVGKSKVLKAVSVCILYGYLDYAMEIFGLFSSMFTEDEKKRFETRVRRGIPLSRRIPLFRGRGRLADIVHAVYRIIHPEGKGWVKQGRSLGNLE